MDRAKIFWVGRTQVVQLPQGYRVSGDEVRIRRRGATVILEPIPKDWTWLSKLVGTIDDDFAQAAQERE